MPIPEFYYFMRPALESLADGRDHYWRDIEGRIADLFKLTSAEREERIPSGRKTRLEDRVQWALTYLRQAGLIEKTGRGINRITPAGRTYLSRAPKVIKPADLMEFPEYVEFKQRSSSSSDEAKEPAAVPADTTPQEAIAAAYEELRTALAEDVLERVKTMSPARFEELIVELMLKLGYGGTEASGRTLGRSGDGGVDGVIDQDKLGLEKIYLQAKRWSDGAVGRKEVQAFVGALSGQGANKGVFITSSSFTREAIDYAKRMMNFKLSLVDGLELARLMIEYDLGVALDRRYDVKRLDSDFFQEE
jgi:restriction system protein